MTTVTNRPAKPPLDRDRILRAALALADERGLKALSIRTLAARLGTRPMSLYRHVADKRDILDGMMGLMLAEVPAAAPTGDWAADMRAWAVGFRAVARRHRRSFPLFADRPITSYLAGREAAEAGLAMLAGAGFDDRDAARVLRTVIRHVIGDSLGDAAPDAPGDPAVDPAAVAAGLEREGLPRLAGLVSGAGGDADDLFAFGLDALLDGLALRRLAG